MTTMTRADVTELIIWQFSRTDGHVITCKRPIKQPLARPAHSCAWQYYTHTDTHTHSEMTGSQSIASVSSQT